MPQLRIGGPKVLIVSHSVVQLALIVTVIIGARLYLLARYVAVDTRIEVARQSQNLRATQRRSRARQDKEQDRGTRRPTPHTFLHLHFREHRFCLRQNAPHCRILKVWRIAILPQNALDQNT